MDFSADSGFGEFLALACAFTWATSVVFLKSIGAHLSPTQINAFKNTLGTILFIPTCLIIDGSFQFPVEFIDFSIVVLSGAVGIGVADGLFLYGLDKIGAARTAVVDCLFAPTVIVIAAVFFGESMSTGQMFGSALIIFAILLVSVRARAKHKEAVEMHFRGWIAGVVAIIMMGSCILCLKPMFSHSGLISVILLRLIAGTIVSWILVFCVGSKKETGRRSLVEFSRRLRIMSQSQRTRLVVASFLATFVSMGLWVSGYKYTQAMTAAVLNQMSTVITVVLAWAFLKEDMTWRKILATIVSMIGACFVVLC